MVGQNADHPRRPRCLTARAVRDRKTPRRADCQPEKFAPSACQGPWQSDILAQRSRRQMHFGPDTIPVRAPVRQTLYLPASAQCKRDVQSRKRRKGERAWKKSGRQCARPRSKLSRIPRPGKLEIRATKPLANGRDLSRAYCRRRGSLPGDQGRCRDGRPLLARQSGGGRHQRHGGAGARQYRGAGIEAGDRGQSRPVSRNSPISTALTSNEPDPGKLADIVCALELWTFGADSGGLSRRRISWWSSADGMGLSRRPVARQSWSVRRRRMRCWWRARPLTASRLSVPVAARPVSPA